MKTNTIMTVITRALVLTAFIGVLAGAFFVVAPDAQASFRDISSHIVCIDGCGLSGGFGFPGYQLNTMMDGGGGGGGETPTPWCTLSTIQPVIAPGGSASLLWSSLNITSLTIDNGVGPAVPVSNGTILVYPTETTTYIATGTGPHGTVTCQTTVTVTPPPPPATCELYAAPTTISSGESSALSWITNGLVSFTIDHGVGTVTPTAGGVRLVTPAVTTTYTGTGNSVATGQPVQCSVVITVTPPQLGCIQILKETFSPTGTVVTPVAQFTFKLDGNAQTTQNDANGNAVFYNVTPGAHDVSEIIPNSTWTQLSVTPVSGHVIVPAGPICAAVVFKNKQVINNPPPPVCTLTSSPSTIDLGDHSTLTWTTSNATSFSIDQGIGSVTPVAGGQYVSSPTHTVTFTGTATGPGGTVTCDTTVTVTPPPVNSCGVDIALVLDMSQSISNTELNQMKSAVVPFVNSFDTNAQFSLTSFVRTATVNLGFTSNKTTITNAVNALAIGSLSGTNWDDALAKAQSTFDPRPSAPNVIVLASDGQPNTYGTSGSAPQSPITPALNAAIARANIIKTGGTRIVTLGIGSNVNVAHLQAVASPGDYFTTANFSTVGAALQDISDEMCGGTITVKKIIDADGNLATTNDQTPGNNWNFGVDSTVVATDATGFTDSVSANAGTHSVTESYKAGYSLVGASCTGAVQNGSLTGSSILNIQVGSGSHVVCTFYNKPVTPPAQGCIKVLKETFDTTGNALNPVAQFTFKLDGDDQTAVNDAAGNAIFNNVPVGTHQVTEIIPNASWTQLSATPNNGSVVVTAGPICAAVVFKNKQVPPPPPGKGCIKVLKETFDTNGNALTPVAQFTFTLDGSQTAQNDAAGNAIFNDVTVGTHSVTELVPNTWTQLSVTPNSGSVIVAAGTQCAAVVFKNKQVLDTPPGPACTLSVSASQINPGQSIIVSWTSQNVTSGSINHNVGPATPVNAGSKEVFPSDDTTYTGTFTGPYGTVTCSAPVTLIHSACTSNCGGGGLDQPRVVLFQKPGDAPLAFVTLAQIPYTGFEAGFALTIAFWLAIGLIAAMIAYVVMGRGGIQTIIGGTLALVGAGEYTQMPREYARPMPRMTEPEPVETVLHEDSAAYSASVMAASAPVQAMPTYRAPANDGIPELSDVIEARAHGAGVLMSPESVHMALDLSNDRAETLRVFGSILNEAVKTIPREDGWILLTTERFQSLAAAVPAHVPATMTTSPSVEQILGSVPTPPSPLMHVTRSANVEMPMAVGADQAVAMTLADAILSGNRDQAYATARSLETSGANAASVMTVIATALDQLYRARRHGTTTELTSAATSVSDAALTNIVEAFAEGMDHGYSNPYTGLKLAIAQAFEARG